MDNLPKDPPDQNTPESSTPDAPNPPNIPDHPSVHSDVAKHRKRDAHGRFTPSERLASPSPPQPTPNPQTPLTSQTTPNPSNFPPPITVTENTKYSEKKDPPLFNISVIFTNPVTYLKNWVSRFLKNQDIDLRLKIKPFATIGLVLAFTAVGGGAFSLGRYIFPNSSPILHRQVVYSGIVKAGGGFQNYFLMGSDSKAWKLKAKNNNINISDLLGKQVVVTGNLTAEPNLIEVSEVIVFDTESK